MSPRTSLSLLLPLAVGVACVSPDDAPVGPEGQVTRELRAPLDVTWRETVAAIHVLGIVVPHDQRPDTHAGSIRTEELRVDLLWIPAEEVSDVLGTTGLPERTSATRATVLFYDRDPLRARVRGESLLDTIEDRLDLRAR